MYYSKKTNMLKYAKWCPLTIVVHKCIDEGWHREYIRQSTYVYFWENDFKAILVEIFINNIRM